MTCECCGYTSTPADVRFIAFSHPGLFDAYVMLPGGRYLELEFKTGSGTLSDDQRNYAKQLKELGIPYAVVHADTSDGAIARSASLTVQWIKELEASHGPTTTYID